MTTAEIVSCLIAALALVVSTASAVWTMRGERRAERRTRAAEDRHWKRTEAALEALYGRPVKLPGVN